jgi:hypothetical protein
MWLTALRWDRLRFASAPTPGSRAAAHGSRCRRSRPVQSAASGAPTTLVVVDRHDPERLTIRAKPFGTDLTARVLAGSLDRRLAAGLPPEAGVLLAARAQRLNSPARCRQLAESWQRLLAPRRQTSTLRSPSVPVCRSHIVAAEAEIRSMLTVLTAPGPKSVRGTATANLLLIDGTGPIYNPRSPIDLGEAVREAVQQMEPSEPVTRWTLDLISTHRGSTAAQARKQHRR